MTDTGSILTDTKKVLGIDENYTEFDTDVAMHINTSLMTLQQLGVGPVGGLAVTDSSTTWSDLTPDIVMLGAVKSFIYMNVRLMFDPPQTSFALDAIQKQVDQLIWRIGVTQESLHPPTDPLATV